MDLITKKPISDNKPNPLPRLASDILWVFRRGRTQAFLECLSGKRPRDFFYGFFSLKEKSPMAFVEEHGFNPIWFFTYPIEKLIAMIVKAGFAIHIPLWNLRRFRQAKVIITTSDGCGLPVAFLKIIGLIKGKLIYLSQGLSDRMNALGYDHVISKLYRWLLLKGTDQLVAFSEGGKLGLAHWLGIRPEKVEWVPFGPDCQFWGYFNEDEKSKGQKSNEILSVGSDAEFPIPQIRILRTR